MELDGHSFISSSTGYTAKIDYSGKGWLSGKKNSFVATLYPTGKEKEAVYNCSGQWTKAFEIHKGGAKHNSSSTLLETWDPEKVSTSPLQLAPIEKQHPLESRKAWRAVAEGISQGDMDLVSREKSKIENAQRAARKREAADGTEWVRRYFTALPAGSPDEILDQLAPHVGVSTNGDADKTGGLWRFDASKAAKVKEEQLSEEQAAAIARDLLGQE